MGRRGCGTPWGQDADAVVWVSQLHARPRGRRARSRVRSKRRPNSGPGRSHEQHQLGGRFCIAVVAAGAARADGSLRFAVEDLLAAGAIIEAISAVGIDHQSPEAAAAASAYRGLRGATRHLLSAPPTPHGNCAASSGVLTLCLLRP